MPDDRIPISEFDEAPQLDNNDVIPVLHPINNVLTTVKTKLTALGTHLLKVMQFASDLNTSNKTIIGAINELEAGGGGGGSSTLAGLTDTNIVTPQNKQGLVYNSTNNKWENQNIASDFDITNIFSATPIATLTDAAENVPMKSLIVDIKPQQASGTPTPSSPLPISGFTGANITHTGKNLVTGVIEGGSIGSNGTIAGGSTQYDMVYAPIKAGVTYTISTNETTNQFVGGYFTSLPSVGSTSYDGQRIVQYSKTFTAPITGYVVFRQMSGYEYAQLETGNQATTYEPYTATTIPISWQTEAGTVYGGTYDVTTGKLTVTDGIADLGSLTWTLLDSQGGVSRFLAQVSGMKEQTVRTMDIKCSCAVCNKTSQAYLDNSIYNVDNHDQIIIATSLYNDKDTFKAAMSGMKATFKLATPIVYTLTPTTIKTQGGMESIFADCGEVEGEYYTEQADDIVDLHNAIDAEKETVLAGTLEAGETEITFTSTKITADSMIEVWTSPVGVNYSAIAVSTGQVVITFAEQASDIGVKVVIK